MIWILAIDWINSVFLRCFDSKILFSYKNSLFQVANINCPVYLKINRFLQLLLYCHLLIHAEIYIYMLYTYRRNELIRRKDKDAGRLLYKNIYLSLYCKGSKGLFKVCVWEGTGNRTWLKYFDPEVMAVSVVSFSFSMAAQPEHWSPLCWVLAFLTTSRLPPSPTFSPQLNCLLLFNSSALYYLQTPTRWYGHASAISSDIWRSGCITSASLEWPVWSSSSGNNCHAVQRSLSSGASVYESIMGFFFLPRPISSANFRPRDFLS